ncbi:MAG: hypothetical protein V8S86_11775 [Eubacteriales bacterium]
MDSVNATMLLVVVTVLVVGFYLFTLKPREDVTGAVAPLHMVVCVVSSSFTPVWSAGGPCSWTPTRMRPASAT